MPDSLNCGFPCAQRRDHRALRSQHGAVIEQLRTVCMLNEELEARVQVQAQLLGSVRSAAQSGHGPYLAVHGDAPGNMCDLGLAASLGQLLHYELPTAAGMAGGGTAATGARAHSVAPGQEDGNDDEEDAVGGLDLIMEVGLDLMIYQGQGPMQHVNTDSGRQR